MTTSTASVQHRETVRAGNPVETLAGDDRGCNPVSEDADGGSHGSFVDIEIELAMDLPQVDVDIS